ncbi:hypothetical protein [Bradyrhizobium phage BDU-MI-1]|nr:hypothetical protein [Bradyrhizobium phage BDU-MI-1]
MFTELEIIERCLLLFSKPGRWCQKTDARDRDGKRCKVFSKEARTFSIEGAIRRAAGEEDRGAYARLAKHIKAQVGKYPFDWNDQPGRTQKEVVRMFEDLADEFRFKEVA